MKVTQTQYDEMTKQASPNSKTYKTIPLAFLIGGLICTLGQFLLFLYQNIGMDEKTAGTMVSVTLILVAALLTGLDVYNSIAKFAGAGTLVPITGFSNAVVAPALEFKSEGYVLGMAAKMFIIAGPVIVYGIVASAVYGVIVSLFGLY